MRKLNIETPAIFEPLLAPCRYKGAKGGRGSGKSYFFADSIIEALILNPDLNVACMREVQKSIAKSSKKLLEDRIRFYEVTDYFEIQQTEIKSKVGNGVIIFQGLQDHTVDSIKSLEGFDVCWVEEAQSISEYSLDLLTPTFRKDNSELWFSWNPRYQTDPIMKLFRQKKDHVLVHADYLNNPFCSDVIRKEAEELKIIDEEKYNHIFLGKEKDNLDALFSFNLINKSRNRTDITNSGTHTWALDVARYGEDTSVLTSRKGQELTLKNTYSKLGLMELSSKVAYEYNRVEPKPQMIFVDGVGVGGGVADRLIQLGIPVMEVNGSSSPDNDIYLNKRTEMYFNFKEFMDHGKALTDDETEEELLAIEYEYNSKDKIQLIAKSKIKEVIGRSPDKSDSFAMHFAYKIQPKITQEYDYQHQQEVNSLW